MSTRPVRRVRRFTATFGAILTTLFGVTFVSSTSARASSYVPLIGDGSSWAQPAIDQWSRDVHAQGITINYSGDGSAAGRQHYIENLADFASSDIAFLTTPDPFGAGTEASSYAYSYVPIVAGGTAFMYNLVVGGRKITNLRLSGETIAKIFTGAITNWNDPAITHDYGQPLPSQKITPVTRSDGAGASYMFTRWINKMYPSTWSSFCHGHGGGGACGPTEFYPQFTGSVQRNGSDQIASYVSSPSFGQGSIGYDEYAYALNNDIPAVKVLNKSGYYTLPTPSNVAIALQAAVIDENPASPTFLMQNLDNVYTNPDSRSYPLSSYNYLVVPRDSRVLNGNETGPPPRFNTDKGKTLSTWMNYVLCGAQQKAGALGYSPLPKNLVVGGFKQIDRVPGHVKTPDLAQLTGCNNPTYSDGVNHLIVDAPKPSACDKVGSPINNCVAGGGGTSSGGTTNGGSTNGGSTNGGSTNGGSNNGTGNNGTGNNGTGNPANNGGGTGNQGGTGPTPINGSGTPTGAGTQVDPVTGLAVGGTNTGNGTAQGSGAIYAIPVGMTQPKSGQNRLLATFTVVDIIAAIAIPGLLTAWLRRRRKANP